MIRVQRSIYVDPVVLSEIEEFLEAERRSLGWLLENLWASRRGPALPALKGMIHEAGDRSDAEVSMAVEMLGTSAVPAGDDASFRQKLAHAMAQPVVNPEGASMPELPPYEKAVKQTVRPLARHAWSKPLGVASIRRCVDCGVTKTAENERGSCPGAPS